MLFLDWTVIFILPAIILSIYAQVKVSTTFAKYSKAYSKMSISGKEAAKLILDSEIPNNEILIQPIAGELTDHYDPSTKTLRLSENVYDSTSIAAIGVAAHEAGHAIQHERGYVPLVIRNVFVPIASFGSSLSFPLLLLGILFSYKPLIDLGILLFLGAVIFHIITLPVELNASSRAANLLLKKGIVTDDEVIHIKKVLNAAALTYVASALMALLQLLRFIVIRNEE